MVDDRDKVILSLLAVVTHDLLYALTVGPSLEGPEEDGLLYSIHRQGVLTQPLYCPLDLLWCHNTAIAGHGYKVECLCVREEAKGGSGVRWSPHLHDPAADVVATYHVHIVVEKIGGGEPTDAISK